MVSDRSCLQALDFGWYYRRRQYIPLAMTIPLRIACVGECMIELSDPEGAPVGLSYGGDTLNTAVYMSRLGRPWGMQVDFLTALGDDPYSERMIAGWQAEKIGTELVTRLSGRLPGLYAIRTDAAGERSFYYWRQQSAAREMLSGEAGARLAGALAGYDLIYLSGITVSILPPDSRERLAGAVATARAKGARVAFDPNYRPRGWADAGEAAAAMAPFVGQSDFVLPGLDDADALYGVRNIEECADRYQTLGAGEICVKDGAGDCLLRHDGHSEISPAVHGLAPVDTTAAGDSFNAAYLVSRLAGEKPLAAAGAGHRLAAAVICYRGAVMPLSAMPDGDSERQPDERGHRFE
jgi:2-dehydro-3-deoxygluconokinase